MQSARRNTAAIIAILAVIVLIAAASLSSITAQTSIQLQPGFSKALLAVQEAEAAGATHGEIAPIIALLNQALEAATTQTAQANPQLPAQVDQLLSQADSQAAQLQAVAAQRTQVNTIVAYVSGGIAALIGTIVYAYGISLWRRYKVKRTFQMRVSAK